jgi:taurine dioxygenase
MKEIRGMTADESQMLLRFLMDHVSSPKFHVRWHWEVDDLAIWDERCTLHRALPDHFPQRRVMRRCTVDADTPPRAPSESGSSGA